METFLDTEQILSDAMQEIIWLCDKKDSRKHIKEVAETAMNHVIITNAALQAAKERTN